MLFARWRWYCTGEKWESNLLLVLSKFISSSNGKRVINRQCNNATRRATARSGTDEPNVVPNHRLSPSFMFKLRSNQSRERRKRLQNENPLFIHVLTRWAPQSWPFDRPIALCQTDNKCRSVGAVSVMAVHSFLFSVGPTLQSLSSTRRALTIFLISAPKRLETTWISLTIEIFYNRQFASWLVRYLLSVWDLNSRGGAGFCSLIRRLVIAWSCAANCLQQLQQGDSWKVHECHVIISLDKNHSI